ncbi:hypothetical protein, partial [Burkholderia glumae]|uniref:hypothetical protein n=1 Tax=Burkholderia glumae TaxID=337 RepID=UPI0020CEAFE4
MTDPRHEHEGMRQIVAHKTTPPRCAAAYGAQPARLSAGRRVRLANRPMGKRVPPRRPTYRRRPAAP